MAIGPSYGPNAGTSGRDPRGRAQNQSQYQQQRYEQQQGPMVNAFARNYGRGAEMDFQDRGKIMRGFGDIASGRGGGVNPQSIGYNDPFKSYGGYEEFSKTGGYSPQDIANMRARGTSPIRAVYANAEREVGRGRSLQGGYSPNAAAAQVKMAREQGQATADATQNVEAGLAEARNRGRLSGLGGMAGIEGQRLGADLDVGMFNANSRMRADESNQNNRLGAVQGMASLYGTTPGMSNAFGNQLLQGVEQGGQFGLNLMGRDIQGQTLPGAFDQTTGRIREIADIGGRAANPIIDAIEQRRLRSKSGPVKSPTMPQTSYSDPYS